MFKFLLSILFYSTICFSQVKPKVSADVKLNPMGDFTAQFSNISGIVLYKNTQITSDKIVMKATTIKTGMDLRDKHAKEKYLMVQTYPDITLTKLIGKAGQAEGLLKIKEKENKVIGTYSVDVQQKKVTGEFKIKLSDFDIKGISFKGVGVEDEVLIKVEFPIKE